MDLVCSRSLVLTSVGQVQDRRSRDEWVRYEQVDLSTLLVTLLYWKLLTHFCENYQVLYRQPFGVYLTICFVHLDQGIWCMSCGESSD